MAIDLSRRFVTTFCVATLFSPSAFAVKELNMDAGLTSLKAEPLEEPSSSDKLYVYTKSPSFSRWIYSPWAKPNWDEKSGQLKLNQLSSAEGKRGVLISEFQIPASKLASSSELILEEDIVCGDSSTNTEGSCFLKFVVRCYGKTKDSPWGVSFENVQSKTAKLGEASFNAKPVIINKEKCQQGVYVSAEASTTPGVDSYTFKEIRVGLNSSK